MNRYIEKITGGAKNIRRNGWAWYRGQPLWRQAIEAAAVIALVAFIFIASGGEDILPKEPQANHVVTIAPVSELANTDSSLPLLGTVTSTSEATIRSESSGKLTRVYRKLGDYVTAGQVIAEFENSGERAAVLQAEGAHDSAKAARDISRINSSTTDSSLTESRVNALNTITSAYVTMDDAVRVKTDTFFSNPRNAEAKFLLSVPDMNLMYMVETERKAMEKLIVAREAKNKVLTPGSDLVNELNLLQSEVQAVKKYLDDLSLAYTKAVPDATYSQATLDSGRATVGVARSAISGAMSSVTAARSALTGSVAAQEVAEKTSGDTSGTVATADATVKQALGAYNAALSRLEKTVIRSPITGTLNSLSIETGDFISAFTEVAVVSNNGALEVLAYVTEDDARRISVGNEVMIDNAVKGVITRIASAIDPRTKKIEVRIGITGNVSELVNGQSVRVNITKKQQSVTTSSDPIKIPLSALKLTPNGAFVFTMSATSSLIALPVKEGAILGDEIQILSGLNGTESIVVDARGLKAGMVVTVQE